MSIDWFTVAAQIINFLVLVWLLQKFLYRPVLAAIDAREQGIQVRISDAETREAKAKAEEEKFRQSNEAFATERATLLGKANDDAGLQRQHLLESARAEAETLRANLANQLIKERDALRSQVVTHLQAEVFALTASTLAGLADVSVEQRMVEVFLRRLGETTLPAVGTAHVRTAFELSPQQRALIEQKLGAPVEFECAAQLICGIELTVGDLKMAWTIPDHLDGISQKVTELLTPGAAADG